MNSKTFETHGGRDVNDLEHSVGLPAQTRPMSTPTLTYLLYSHIAGVRLLDGRTVFDEGCQESLCPRSLPLRKRIPSIPKAHLFRT